MAVLTHWCAVMIMLPLIQGLLGARQGAQCGPCVLAEVPGTTAGKALLILPYGRIRPNVQ